MEILIFFILVLIYFLLLKPGIRYGKDSPFIPMDAEVAGKIIEGLQLSKEDVFYDLGSGDGRLVIAAAMKGAKATGVEINLLNVFYSRLWIRVLGLHKSARIIHGDIFQQNYRNATVINCYLLQDTVDKLEEKLSKELKKGTKVISTAFPFTKWKVNKVDPRGTIYGPIYYYEV